MNNEIIRGPVLLFHYFTLICKTTLFFFLNKIIVQTDTYITEASKNMCTVLILKVKTDTAWLIVNVS